VSKKVKLLADVTQRRLDKFPPKPERAKGLPDGHSVLVEARTIFVSRVFSSEEVPRILVSGHNNRKIGRRVVKGRWSGMEIYTLTLEERATCPTSCEHWGDCYGNAMHWSRRVANDDTFLARLGDELKDLAEKHRNGFVVRLHVLGDFYSRNYVEWWAMAMASISQLHVMGFTAWPEDSEIGLDLIWVRKRFSDRWWVRFSGTETKVINYVPDTLRVKEGLICPAQNDGTLCCATCSLCWTESFRDKSVVFIRHGKIGRRTKVQISAQKEN